MTNLYNLFGKPYFEARNCVIYNLDCLEAMKRINDPFVHLTVTSPPYNIGKSYEKQMPLTDYISWCVKWIKQTYRLTVDNGAFWLNLGYKNIEGRGKAITLLYLLWEKVPFFLVQEIVWNYGAGVAGKKFFSPRNEKFLWYVKNEYNYTFNLDEVRDPNVKYPNQKKNGKIKVNSDGKNPSDVWQFPKVTSGQDRSSKERTPHPAQFPEQVIERIILSSSNLNEQILDPFLGSGTTALVSLRLGRYFVGFELNSTYCQIAADRVERFIISQKDALQLELPL